MIKYKVMGGSLVRDAIIQIQRLANLHNEPYCCEFNSVTLIANPGDSFETVEKPWLAKQAEWAKEREAKKVLATQIRNAKLTMMTGNGMVLTKSPPEDFVFKGAMWSKESGLKLITPAQLAALPVGTVLKSIMGEEVIVGVDTIDTDTRGGYTAYGFVCPK